MESTTTLSSFLPLSLLLFLISATSLTASTDAHDLPLPSTLATAKTQTAKLLRNFNLFPQHDINLASVEASVSVSRITEKLVKLPTSGSSGATVSDLGHHAGYYKLPNSTDARMFYFFFESRTSKKDPVVIWLTGGPGCSSELALFYENGPYHIANNMSLVWNDYGWDKVSNLIYVDQPTGTGFSYSSNSSDTRRNEEGVSQDLYDFMQVFFKEHPEYAQNDFYITGESYAGHYIPAFASRINQGNKKKEGIHINLKGLAIGNGFTSPEIQYRAYPDYALDMGLITTYDSERLKQSVSQCAKDIKLCGPDEPVYCSIAYSTCDVLFSSILRVMGNTNTYDIRTKCQDNVCYDFSNMEKFLNQESVRNALGVGDREFVSCSSDVYNSMLSDWMRNLDVGIPALLEDGIKLLVYAGEYDFICNWLGNSRWVHAMKWSGKKAFKAAPMIPWTVDGVEAGHQKNHGPLTFLKVSNAGHLVPMDQPKAALEMIKRWTQAKTPLTTTQK